MIFVKKCPILTERKKCDNITPAITKKEVIKTKKILRTVFISVFSIIFVAFVAFCLSSDVQRLTDVSRVYTQSPDKKPGGIISNLIPNLFNNQPDGELKQRTFFAEDKYVRPIGRTLYYQDVRWFSMSGSGVEFYCKGEYADITLTAYNAQYLTYNHKPRVAVYANGTLVADVIIEQASQVVRVDLKEFKGEAEIKIVKLSESLYSCAGISLVEAFAKRDIAPTADDKLLIEFIGDSITAGYGLDETNRNAGFSTRTENFSETYAFLASEMLGTDCYAVAYSGYGALSGFTTGGVLRQDYVISKVYDRAVDGVKTDESVSTKWGFNSNSPDIVVINLGANDSTYCTTAERRRRFVEEYKNLLYTVRAVNPSAFIVCILGNMNDTLYPSVEEAISQYTMEYSDFRTRSTVINFDMGKYTNAIDGHPSKESNAVAAQELVDYLLNNILVFYR